MGLFKNLPFPQGFWWFSRKKDPWKECFRKLTWKLPEGICKWNQVFYRDPGSFYVSLGAVTPRTPGTPYTSKKEEEEKKKKRHGQLRLMALEDALRRQAGHYLQASRVVVAWGTLVMVSLF